MRNSLIVTVAATGVCLVVAHGAPLAQRAATQTAAPAPASAKTWVGRVAEIEAYLKTAGVVRLADAPRGVTRSKRAFLEPGGPVDSFAWKPLASGTAGGFRESYQAEIAAYEINKLLQLDLVPPKVERTVDGEKGAAIMWVTPTKSFADLGGPPTPPPAMRYAWTRQLIKAKMFHNLIGDIDPNLGNWLVDPAWNLILVDHSRALTTTSKLVHEMDHVDAPLWDRIKALNRQTLAPATGGWLTTGEVDAILVRRDEMQKAIDRLVSKKGSAQVFVR
jgi:hypothetical protein